MADKIPLPIQFSDGVVDYSLVYFPNLPAGADARYSVEPNTSRMMCVGRNIQHVDVAGRGKMFFLWVMMQLPPVTGTTQPARNYLFFRLSDKPIPFDLLTPGNMICYAVTPKNVVDNPAQGFVNNLFGQAARETDEQKRDNWAHDLFDNPNDANGGQTVNDNEPNA